MVIVMRALIVRPCGGGNSVKTWDDTSRGDRQEVARRRVTASPFLSLRLEKRELARLE